MSKILVVDPEPIVRQLLQELLATEGREIHSAPNGSDALELSAALGGVDVMIVDSQLCAGSGLARELLAASPKSELLLTSAAPTVDALLEGVEMGAREFLAKPFDDISQVDLRVRAAEDRVALRAKADQLVEALRDSEERYRGLFAASPDAVVVSDELTGAIIATNPACERLYGYPPRALLGKHRRQLRAPAERGAAPDLSLWRTSVERQDVRCDGSAIDVEVSRATYSAGDRKVVVEIIRDVSARLRAEAERAALAEQLRHAQKTEALGLLAGGIAHDFNNLLAVILNYARFVSDGLEAMPQSAEVRATSADLRQIVAAARSATSITRQLLTFSRRELVAPEVLDPIAVILEMESLLRVSLGSRAELVLDLAPTPEIHIDRGQLEQILLNLAVNARDAMAHGGKLTICTRRLEASAPDRPDRVCIVFSDTGSGIPCEVLPRIFDPFFTTKERGKGTGLGLATVRGVVEQAGGEIRVDTTLGAGTTFSIELPGRARERRQSTDRAPLASIPPGSETILVADDDDVVRAAARRILQRAGYSVVEARGGKEAARLCEPGQKRVDLVLTDMIMPAGGGEELALELKSRRPSVPVVFVSGCANESVMERIGSDTGAMIPKPFEADVLLETVRELLDRRRRRSRVGT